MLTSIVRDDSLPRDSGQVGSLTGAGCGNILLQVTLDARPAPEIDEANLTVLPRVAPDGIPPGYTGTSREIRTALHLSRAIQI